MNAFPRDDRAAILTPPGRGAVAVVAVHGAAACAVIDARFRAVNHRPLAEQPVGRIVFGHWQHAADHAEEAIVCRLDADRVEVHCHGGLAAAGRIAAALAEGGSRIESWQEWLAHEHAASPLTAVAAVALAAATTRSAAAILLDQWHGALRRAIESIRDHLLADRPDAARGELEQLLIHAPLGLHLTQPWLVTLAGRPNVGKSSLINALLGYERAIVFDQPGTTRDVLTAETAIGGWPVRLTDAAGIRETADELEAEGVARARRQVQQADLIIWVIDAAALSESDLADVQDIAHRELATELARGGATNAPSPLNVLIALNKIDLVSPLPPSTAPSIVPVSALTGTGLGNLLTAIAQRLVPARPAPGAAIPFTPRHVEQLTAALNALETNDPPSAIASLNQLLTAHYPLPTADSTS